MKTSDAPLRKDAERNRQRILSAARELFAQRGLGVTLNEIAHHAGVGVGTVYRRFPDRAQLIDELFEQRVEEVIALAREALEEPDPWRALTGFLASALALQADDRAIKELMLASAEGVARIERVRAQLLPIAGALVERARAAGQLRPDFQAQDMPLVQLMVGAVIDCARDVRPDLWQRFLGLVLDGMRARPGAEPLPAPPAGVAEIAAIMAAWQPPRR